MGAGVCAAWARARAQVCLSFSSILSLRFVFTWKSCKKVIIDLTIDNQPLACLLEERLTNRLTHSTLLRNRFTDSFNWTNLQLADWSLKRFMIAKKPHSLYILLFSFPSLVRRSTFIRGFVRPPVKPYHLQWKDRLTTTVLSTFPKFHCLFCFVLNSYHLLFFNQFIAHTILLSKSNF